MAVAVQQIGIVELRRTRGTERRGSGRTAFAVGERIEEVALRREVAVRVGPGSVRGVDQRVDRIGIAAERIQRLPEEVLVERHLQRRLAVAAQIVSSSGAIGEVVPPEVVLRREGDVAIRHEWTRPDVLFREAGGEVVVAQRQIDRELVHRPLVLSEESEVVILIALRRKRRRVHRHLVRDAVVEAVLERLVFVGFLQQVTMRPVESHLEAVRAGHVRHRGAVGEVRHEGVVEAERARPLADAAHPIDQPG